MSELRVVAIIQARMTSTRLPGKVLLPIREQPMLAWVVERARLASSLDQVVVATTTDPDDDPVAEFCQDRGYLVTRGHPVDVLDRYWKTVELYPAATVVRLTADCPLIDPDLIDQTVRALQTSDPAADFATNRLPWERTFPIGLDVEVCTRQALQQAWEEASEPYQREHVMPFLYEQPERFRIILLNAEEDYGKLRWTVDTPQDLEFVRAITALLPTGKHFGWRDVLKLQLEHPQLAELNKDVRHKTHRDVG